MWWSDGKMKVFISWSGDVSLKVANVFREWIPFVFTNIEPYFSTEDTNKGSRWSSNIAKELEDTNFGILCVTRENLDSSWLNFEAGALSKSMEKSKVCPFLFDLKPSDILDEPILQFQMTNNEKNDIYKLFKSMNDSLEDKGLEEDRLKKMFELSWIRIEEELKSIENDKTDNTKKRSNGQSIIMEEMLDLLRSQQIILRNPEKLLPISYLKEIVELKNDSVSKIPKHILREWEFMRNRLINDRRLIDNSLLGDFIMLTNRILDFLGVPLTNLNDIMLDEIKRDIKYSTDHIENEDSINDTKDSN